jgi:hypothetical protein
MSDQNIKNPAYRIETRAAYHALLPPSDAQMLADSITESVEHLKPWMPWAHQEPEPFETKAER